MRALRIGLWWCAILCSVACQPQLPNPALLSAVTALPTRTITPYASPISPSPIPSPDATQVACSDAVIASLWQQLPDYEPTTGAFVTIINGQLLQTGQPYRVYGVTYAPREYPGRFFLRDAPLDVVRAELDILQRDGFNTLRIFVHYDDLFICPTNHTYGGAPLPERWQRLDAIIQAAVERGFKLIIVLDHTLDTANLLDVDTRLLTQTQTIVQRYAHEPAILAWDVLDKGDAIYRLQGEHLRVPLFTWLLQKIGVVRQFAPQHIVTAGWWQDAAATAPLVDMVSFQHYGDYEALRQEIAILRSEVPRKPILLAAIGYSTLTLSEQAQRNLLYQSFEEVRHNGLAGWVVHTAFDHPISATCGSQPDCTATDNNHYGLYNTSYYPKLAIDGVKRIIAQESP